MIEFATLENDNVVLNDIYSQVEASKSSIPECDFNNQQAYTVTANTVIKFDKPGIFYAPVYYYVSGGTVYANQYFTINGNDLFYRFTKLFSRSYHVIPVIVDKNDVIKIIGNPLYVTSATFLPFVE